MFPSEVFEFIGISANSGVSDQPMSDDETLTGALNRINHAKSIASEAAYWVGIEGGIERINKEMNAFAWIVIQSKQKLGKAKTGTFFLPQKVMTLIDQGIEMGEADDIVFGQSNSKQTSGATGILTGNVIDRTSLYEHAVVLALIPFKNPTVY